MKTITDFLVIGTGIAGLSYALKVADQGTVALITKDNIEVSATQLAQGGIASVFSDEDSFTSHAEDTMVAGAHLSDPENPVLIGEYQKEMSYIELYILDQYIRKTSNEGILSVDISDLDKYVPIKGLPETLGTFTASDSYIYSVIKNPDKYAASILQIFEIK